MQIYPGGRMTPWTLREILDDTNVESDSVKEK